MSSHPLMGASIPPVTPDLIAKARLAAPVTKAVPNLTTLDEIMYAQGWQDAIEWFAQFAKQSIVTGKL